MYQELDSMDFLQHVETKLVIAYIKNNEICLKLLAKAFIIG